MAQYGEQRYSGREPGRVSPERPFDEDQGGRQRFENERNPDHQRFDGGSERFSGAGNRDRHAEYSYGGHRTSYEDDYDYRGYGRGQHERHEEPGQRHPGYGHGSGYGGYGHSPGEAGGSFDSARSYSAEPGWGPGYGERRHDAPSRDSNYYGQGQRHEGGAYGERWRHAGSSGMQHEYGRAGAGSGNYGYEGRYGFQGSLPGGEGYSGPHRRHEFRGPKGYQRSDERLKEDISERLMAMGHYVDSSDVSVDVKDGKVTLEGTVPERRMKHAIEDVVDDCMGVKDIDNRIRVNRDPQSTAGSGDDRARMSIGGGSQTSISGMGEGTSTGQK